MRAKQIWPAHTCLRVINCFTVNLEKYRKRYFCPIKGCTSTKPIKKLTNHLTTVHGIMDGARRRELAARAREAGPAAPGTRKVSITITEAFQRQEAREKSRSSFLLVPDVVVKKGSTKHYPRFNIDKDPLLLRLVENLQSFDGGKRSEREAREMASDISKYLAFVTDEAKWESMLR